MSECGWCGRSLDARQERRVPSFVRYAGGVALAFLHAGMWAMEWLANPFCKRCRAVLVPAIFAGVAAQLAVVAFLIRLWLRR